MKSLVKELLENCTLEEMREMRRLSVSSQRGIAGLPSTESLVRTGILAKAIDIKIRVEAGHIVTDSSYESNSPLLNRLYRKVNIATMLQCKQAA
ncbi:hypothetical protein LMH73_027080 [Vibrio splendidus]|nr:hypothetical protein [Vibrio splendidus]MCC4880850.1 hypothetical protein [Vibrio splendidus]